LDFLLTAQNADGGWGYAPEHFSCTEPTAAAVLALQAESAGNDAYRRGLDWLRQGQHSDGGWGFAHADGESTWLTAWAVLALACSGDGGDAVSRGIQWLLDVKTLPPSPDDEMQKEFRWKNGVDLSLRGWPWLPGEAAWVEPTALTMLAFAWSPPAPQAAERMAEAVRCLMDRRCANGGWNVGSPVMLGAFFPARAHPTAWSLLALACHAPNTILPEDAAVLQTEMLNDGGVLALAWGLVALRVLGQENAKAQSRLASYQQPDGSWNQSPYETAVAMLAAKGWPQCAR
jgi:hypothetical protein